MESCGMKLSELYTDESKWVKTMFSGYRATPTAEPVRRSEIALLGGSFPAPNCFCLLEGIRQVITMDAHRRATLREKIKLAIQKLFPERINGIIGFNDHPDTTFADVQAVIREVESTQ